VRQIAFEPFVSTREGHTGFGLTSVAITDGLTARFVLWRLIYRR
jgi:hypothetical protein